MGRNPRPAGLHLGPEALLPDHAVLVGVVLSGNVEAIGSRRLTRVVIGTVLGRAVLVVVQPIGLAVAPETGDAIPAVLVALPVAIDPESTWRRHPPRPRYPDIILAAWVPLPVSLNPLGIGAGRIDGGPFADRGRRGLGHVNRIAVLAGRQKRLVERSFGHRPDWLVGELCQPVRIFPPGLRRRFSRRSRPVTVRGNHCFGGTGPSGRRQRFSSGFGLCRAGRILKRAREDRRTAHRQEQTPSQ